MKSFGQDVTPRFWEMHIFIETFVREELNHGFFFNVAGSLGLLRCQDWSLCLKEAFLAAQKELLDFAAREGGPDMRDDGMTMPAVIAKNEGGHIHIINISTYIKLCN